MIALQTAAGEESGTEQKTVLAKNGNRQRNIPAEDIFYIESSSRKVILHMAEENIEYYDKISKLEKELEPEFFRIHKGYLVNMKYIKRYGRTELMMTNGDSLLISKYRYQDFLQHMKGYEEDQKI